eukprot:scaffold92088_cov63-Phaeocystis_antarctica.AAC.3
MRSNVLQLPPSFLNGVVRPAGQQASGFEPSMPHLGALPDQFVLFTGPRDGDGSTHRPGLRSRTSDLTRRVAAVAQSGPIARGRRLLTVLRAIQLAPTIPHRVLLGRRAKRSGQHDGELFPSAASILREVVGQLSLGCAPLRVDAAQVHPPAQHPPTWHGVRSVRARARRTVEAP